MKNIGIFIILVLIAASCSKSKKTEAVLAKKYDREAVRKSFIKHQKQYSACYQQALLKEKKASGKITMDFDIMEDGFVGRSMIDRKKTSFSPYMPEFERCILSVLKSQKFPETPEGIVMQIFYPMAFSNDSPNNKKAKE